MRHLLASLAPMVGIGVSALLLSGRWWELLLLGAAMGFLLPMLLINWVFEKDSPTASHGLNWGRAEFNFAMCLMLGFNAALLWTLFGNGMLHALQTVRPVLASAMVNTTGMSIGITAWQALNRKRFITR
jgi:hypothetical protein